MTHWAFAEHDRQEVESSKSTHEQQHDEERLTSPLILSSIGFFRFFFHQHAVVDN